MQRSPSLAVGLAAALLLIFEAPRARAAEPQSPSAGAWQFLRQQFYADRPIGLVGDELMSVEAPASTADPAATPVTVRFGGAALGHLRQLRVIIDNNPSPLVATFDLADGARVGEIGLRVRVDRFTSVRAIAEMSDGTLEMRSQWVNASGGCSAAPSPAAGGRLGEIRFRSAADGRSLQVSVRHPNNSGFQIDPVSGNPIAPHYVAHWRVTAAGQPFFTADTGISLSENPTIRIASDRPLPAPMTVDLTDSQQARFSGEWRGVAAPSAGNVAAPPVVVVPAAQR